YSPFVCGIGFFRRLLCALIGGCSGFYGVFGVNPDVFAGYGEPSSGFASQQINPQLALQVLLQFDKAINSALAQRVRNRVNFRGSLNTYRFCDNVWTFVLNDVEFREVTDLVKVDKVKIVACDGKNTGSNTAE
uniref:Transcription initiation factor IIA subunit 2 n=1 Tax=Leptobrachium leishanense TaxID=445787 RepID=A0A8C5M2K1_9ANUR